MRTHRDLAQPEFWLRSSERSHRRRQLLPKARREHARKRNMSAALAGAMLAGPGASVAAAQMSSNVKAAVAGESPANRAIEIREGGLPLQLGSQGDLVAHVQRALGVSADGIFSAQTDTAVREYQARAGLEVDGIVGHRHLGRAVREQLGHERRRELGRWLQRSRGREAAHREAPRRGGRGPSRPRAIRVATRSAATPRALRRRTLRPSPCRMAPTRTPARATPVTRVRATPAAARPTRPHRRPTPRPPLPHLRARAAVRRPPSPTRSRERRRRPSVRGGDATTTASTSPRPLAPPSAPPPAAR